MTQAARVETFRRLHESGCFVLPNPWDAGSARLLAQLGFRALATTSSGFAWSVGRPDNGVTLEQALAHLRAICKAVFAETIRRLQAFAAAGADCLYAPRLPQLADFRTVVEAVAPKPVNGLVGGPIATVAEMAALGVRRISVGGALARAAWTGFLAAAREIAEQGTFTALGGAIPFDEINERFRSA
jgi:2-methylisocitrate lyase-like PEP mutase family enzyme